MPIPTIQAAEPVVVDEQVIPAKTYDKMWLAQCNIQSFVPGGEAAAHVELVKFAYDETNGYQTSSSNASVTFTIENLMTKAETDEDLATIMYLLMNYVIKMGREQGVVAPEPEPIP